MYREPNESDWKPLDLSDDYALGTVWQRFESLAQWDPYVSMLSDHVINRLCAGLTSPECIGTEDRKRVREEARTKFHARRLAMNFLSNSPLCELLTVEFRSHITSLLIRAMFPKV